VKRYVAEPGSDAVRDAMAAADAWFCCRIGYVETVRAVGLVAGTRVAEAVRREWPSFAIVEIDEELAEEAAALSLTTELRSLDALHLAAALVLPRTNLTLATWDRGLHAAASARGVRVLPEAL
jgi:uncharacterized protein